MSKRFLRITFPVILVVAIFFLGPGPVKPEWSTTLPVVPSDPSLLESYVQQNESKHRLKPDNEARIVWADSTRSKTKYAVVYLHGFSASQKEGDPVHRRFAKEFGCNLYLSRLADHGIDTTEALLNFTVDREWGSAKEALMIGKAIGDHVILMSTSTGGTMALALAAEFPDDVFALINMSPNIRINNGAAFILNDPWGLNIARLVKGGKYNQWEASTERAQYWNNKYRLEATVQLEEMLESKMKEETFAKVKQPCLTLYYYKSEQEQDPEVKVSAMLTMMKQLGTADDLKRAVAIPTAGAHVLGSDLVSRDVDGVYKEIEKFAEEILKLPKP
ncbi:MAG TPA: alpha/beta hydrolase [Cyclobacteriaceae bacterium]|nr:alpha/beta hydrolase [Cyclobacteriaceae bacterium]